MSWRLPTAGTVFLLLVPIVGCDSAQTSLPATYKVSGTVKLNGKPVPKGTILFEAENDSAKGLAPASSEIKDGKYELEARAGANIIKIRAPVEAGPADATGVKPMKETIPPKYNVNTTLKKTVETSGENSFNFELTSAPGSTGTPDPAKKPDPKKPTPMKPAPKK